LASEDDAGVAFSGYNIDLITQANFGGGQPSKQDLPKRFGVNDRDLPPHKEIPKFIPEFEMGADPGEEAQHPGADEFASGHASYARNKKNQGEFHQQGGFSRLKVRTDATKASTENAVAANLTESPRIDFTPEKDLQALARAMLQGVVPAPVGRQPSRLDDAPAVTPTFYSGGLDSVRGVAPRARPTLQMVA